MKKNKLKISFVAVLLLFMGSNIWYNLENTNKISDLAMNNVEALASWEDVTDWWGSKVYTCQQVAAWEYRCMKYKDIPREDGGWEIDFGKFDPEETVCGYFKVWDTDCVSGNSVAHCWDC